MDEIPSLERRPGGNVEPMSRTSIIKSQFRIPDPPPGQRFELRDPFAEVTTTTINRLANALGVPPTDLLEDVPEE